MSETEINQQAAKDICSTRRLNGHEFRVGECVALLDGKIVAVEKNLTIALKALRTLDKNPQRGMIFEVGPLVDFVR